MIKLRLSLCCLIVLLVFSSEASFAQNISLQEQRVDVIKQYIKLLGKGDYKTIPQLFTKDALAISSSGVPDNPVHFYKTLFTKTISNPQSSLINIFEGKINANMLVGYFNFTWKNKENKKVHAKFLDLFIFQKGTVKIKTIFVFSNTFQKDIMKQLESN